MPKSIGGSRTIKRAFLESADEQDHELHESNKSDLPPAINQPVMARPPSKAAKRSRRKLLRNVEEMLSGRITMEALNDKSLTTASSGHNQNVDLTTLQEELSLAKKKLSQATKQKTLLQAQNMRLDKEIQKQGRQMDQLLKSSIDNSSGNFDRTGILEALRQEKCKVTSLQAKVQSLESDKTALEHKLETMSASLKFSAVRELRIQNKAYYTEARRLRALAMKVSSNERVIEQDLQKRLEQRTGVIQTQMEQDHNLLADQIKSLEATIAELRQKTVSLTISLEDGAIERASLLNQIDHLGKEKDRVLNQNSEANKTIENMQTVVDTKQNDIILLKTRCEEQQLQLNSLTTDLVEERNANVKLSEKIADLTAQQSTLDANRQSLSEQLQVTITDREAAVSALRLESESRQEILQNFERVKLQYQKEVEDCERLRSELQTSQQQADQIREDLAKELSRAEAYKVESERLSLELQEAGYHHSALQDELKTVLEKSQLQIEQLQRSQSEKAAMELQDQIKSLDVTHKEELERSSLEFKDQIRTLESTIAELHQKTGTLARALEDGAIERASLLKQVDELGQEKERLLSQYVDANKTIENTENDINTLKTRCEDQQAQLNSLATDLEAQKNTNHKLSEQISNLLAQKAVNEANRQSLSEQLQVMLGEREAVAADLSRESDKQQELQQNIESVKLQYQKEVEDCERLRSELLTLQMQADQLRAELAKESSRAETFRVESQNVTIESQDQIRSLEHIIAELRQKSECQTNVSQVDIGESSGSATQTHQLNYDQEHIFSANSEANRISEVVQNDINSLTTRCEDQWLQLNTLAADLDAEKKANQKLCEEIADLRTQQSAVNADHQSLVEQVQAAIAEREAAATALKQESENRQEIVQNFELVKLQHQKEIETCERLRSELYTLKMQTDQSSQELMKDSLNAEPHKIESTESALKSQEQNKSLESTIEVLHPTPDTHAMPSEAGANEQGGLVNQIDPFDKEKERMPNEHSQTIKSVEEL